MEGYHRSVLLREAIKALDVKTGSWYLDCTLGDGGHSLEILKQGGKVVGIDVNAEALKRARGRLGDIVLIQGNFRDLKNLINNKQTETKFAGVLFDLGVSSLQLESSERGFSFMESGCLDMRMDPSLQVRAADLLNALTRKELYELFFRLGEEKYSWAVADAVVSTRKVRSITGTLELAGLVEKVVGRRKGRHPATRIFQALRIAVNDELDALQEGLDQVKDLIKEDGRIVVISFHSLEDRIVKNTFQKWKLAGVGEILTKKPITPGEMEINENSRSRSAKMRVFKVTSRLKSRLLALTNYRDRQHLSKA